MQVPRYHKQGTGEIKPFVQRSVDRQTPVNFSDNVTRLPRTGSQLSPQRRPNGTLFIQDEAQVTTILYAVNFYILASQV